MADRRDRATYRPNAAEFIEVDGHQLHLLSMGQGTPTVVLEAGSGMIAKAWACWIQPELAKSTRVVSYDRAGLGWSEATGSPPTAQHIAQQLHTLLSNSGIPGPYVLVGHSFGGIYIRMYAHLSIRCRMRKGYLMLA
jgi:pimeloyl-ACP methyl ester carboxylesterase